MNIPDPQRWGQLSPWLDELLELPALLADGARAAADGFLGGALPGAAQASVDSGAASLAGQALGPDAPAAQQAQALLAKL